MGQQRCHTQLQVEAEIDCAVNVNQCGQMFKMSANLFIRALDIADVGQHHHNPPQAVAAIKLGVGIHQHPLYFRLVTRINAHDENFQYFAGSAHPVIGILVNGHSGTVLADEIPVKVLSTLAQNLDLRNPE